MRVTAIYALGKNGSLKMSPQVELNGSDCSQLLIIRFTAEVAAVKHDLTANVASQCVFDATSE